MKAILTAVLLSISTLVSAGGAAYIQVPLIDQETRYVNGQAYVGRNPDTNADNLRYFTVTTFDSGAVALVSLRADGSSHEIYTGMLYPAPDQTGSWADLQLLPSPTVGGSYRTHGYLEDNGDSSLTWYVEWCTPGEMTEDSYEPATLDVLRNRPEDGPDKRSARGWWDWVRRIFADLPPLFIQSSETVETGCPVPSRQYIVLEQIK